MSTLFLNHYSFSAGFYQSGRLEHYSRYAQETKWNCRATIHLTLYVLETIPLISQLCYAIEALASTVFAEQQQSCSSKLKEKEPADSFKYPTKDNPTTILGTKNQYTDCNSEGDRQSCTFQTLTFLKYFLADGKISEARINGCVEEALKTFQGRTVQPLAKRKAEASNYMKKNGVSAEVVENLLQMISEEPTLVELENLSKIISEDNAETHMHVLSNILLGASLTPKEAAQSYTNDFSCIEEGCRLIDLVDNLYAPPEEGQGLVLTAGSVTVAFAKKDGLFVVYDSHGSSDANQGKPVAFAKVFATDIEAENFLSNTVFGHTSQHQIDTLTVRPK